MTEIEIGKLYKTKGSWSLWSDTLDKVIGATYHGDIFLVTHIRYPNNLTPHIKIIHTNGCIGWLLITRGDIQRVTNE